MAPSGAAWRCAIAPVTDFTPDHGAILREDVHSQAHYSTGEQRQYFGWNDVAYRTPSQLADCFIERFPDLVRSGRGSDWSYAGWYCEMLGRTYPDHLPVAFGNWEVTGDGLVCIGGAREIRVPLPPLP